MNERLIFLFFILFYLILEVFNQTNTGSVQINTDCSQSSFYYDDINFICKQCPENQEVDEYSKIYFNRNWM